MSTFLLISLFFALHWFEMSKEADLIKIKFIEFLISQNEDIVIGNEVLYSKNQRRADLVMLKNEKLYAFEIKSSSDNLSKLESQIKDYMKTFDYVYVIVEKKHLKIKKKLPSKVGIFLFQDKKIEIIKKASNIKRWDKTSLCEFFKKSDLLKELPKEKRTESVYTLKDKLCKIKTTCHIKKRSVELFEKRYLPLYQLFLSDITKGKISRDDLRSLTGNISTNSLHL